MHDIAHRQLELRMDLAVALERGRAARWPTSRSSTRARTGSAAWRRCCAGTTQCAAPVSPVEFIPVAEQSGHIRAIGEWVLRTACAEAASWTGGGAESYVSVNVSAPQLDDQFVDLVLDDARRDRACLPHRLMLEITESMLVDDSVNARSMLTRLRDVGARVAIDDFGTGFSSLAYFQSLCVDVVKIDRSFVRDLGTNADHRALTRTILSLAEGFEMTAIAEGVETDREFAELVPPRLSVRAGLPVLPTCAARRVARVVRPRAQPVVRPTAVTPAMQISSSSSPVPPEAPTDPST